MEGSEQVAHSQDTSLLLGSGMVESVTKLVEAQLKGAGLCHPVPDSVEVPASTAHRSAAGLVGGAHSLDMLASLCRTATSKPPAPYSWRQAFLRRPPASRDRPAKN